MPYLWDLWYTNYSSGKNDVVDYIDRCLVVDTHAMTNFRIADFSRDSCHEDMPCLEDTHLDVESCHDDKYPTSFSTVLSLHICLMQWYL